MSRASDFYRCFPIFSAVSYSSEFAEALLSDEGGAKAPTKPSVRWKPGHWHWVFHSVSALIIVYFISVVIGLDPDKKLTYLECWERSHTYSPINDVLSTTDYIYDRFNGSLWHPSPFKGPPTIQVEAAWQSAMEYGMIAVSASDLKRAQRLEDLDTAAAFPASSSSNTGKENREEKKYIAVAVGTHQLHCLHFLWQDHHAVFFPNTTQRKQKEVPALYERHYEHCVDYIRQSIMCNFDTSILSYDWVRDHQMPTPNSNVMHRCVDWEFVQGWFRERAVKMPDGFVWSKPEGQASLDFNP
ncbi:hypothetical protein PISL3812_05751 [Talaromyces islandicus]|uniref:Cyclochlorotine biosynthesis protein O n=1 Tax=Talaromyces islandicus TaxID=28573 RepID=A0A0U1LZH9_TALIS|nr:hypothetical protein PISL3812_05751 [Talaromyces islandicus]